VLLRICTYPLFSAPKLAAPVGTIVFAAIREGRDFERLALAVLELEKNTTRLERSGVTLLGNAKTLIPDALNMFPGHVRAGVWEIKNWGIVRSTAQMRAEADLATELRIPFNVVVGNYSIVTDSVKNLIKRTGGRLYKVAEWTATQVPLQ
jgi:hypothetical protein